MSAPSNRSISRALRRRYVEEKLTVRGGITWRDDGWALMQSVLKPGVQGTAAVSHFTITEKDADSFNLSYMFQAGGGMYTVTPSKYVRLHVKNCGSDMPMMSDTPMERRSNWEIRREARGHVLIAGLGIGMVLHPILDRARGRQPGNSWERGKLTYPGQTKLPTVEHVTVVEMNQDVIDLVSPSLVRYGDRITIVRADINEFDPGKQKFDTVYFDIWPTVCEDNLPEIAKLHQRWKSRLNRSDPEHKPWMSSWMVEHLRSERREGSRW